MCGDVARTRVVLEGVAAVSAIEGEQGAGAEEAVREEAAQSGAKENKPVDDIRQYTDVEFRKAYPDICAALLEQARGGRISVIRLLLGVITGKYGDVKTLKDRVGKSLSELLLDELKRRQDEREAAMDAASTEGLNTKANEADGEGVKSGRDAEHD